MEARGYVRIRYSSAPEDWVEHILLAPVPGKTNDWVIADDTGTLFEQVMRREGDVLGVRVQPPDGTVPFGIDQNQIIEMARKPSDAEMDALVAEAEAHAAQLGEAVGGLPPPLDDGPPGAQLGGPVIAAARALRGGGGGPGPGARRAQVDVGGGVNTSTIPLVIKVGDEVIVHRELDVSQVVAMTDALRDAFVAPIGGRPSPQVPLGGLARLKAALNRDSRQVDDARGSSENMQHDGRLPRRSPFINEGGERFIEFRAAVELLTNPDKNQKGEEELAEGVLLEGPPTAVWVCRFQARYRIAPLSGHPKWIQENKVNPESNAAMVHELLCEILEAMLCIDQLDVYKLLSAEIVVRKLQEVEEDQSKEEDHARIGPSFYRGRPRLTGGACICPALQEWASKKMERRVNVMKHDLKSKAMAKEIKDLKAPKGRNPDGTPK